MSFLSGDSVLGGLRMLNVWIEEREKISSSVLIYLQY